MLTNNLKDVMNLKKNQRKIFKVNTVSYGYENVKSYLSLDYTHNLAKELLTKRDLLWFTTHVKYVSPIDFTNDTDFVGLSRHHQPLFITFDIKR